MISLLEWAANAGMDLHNDLPVLDISLTLDQLYFVPSTSLTQHQQSSLQLYENILSQSSHHLRQCLLHPFWNLALQRLADTNAVELVLRGKIMLKTNRTFLEIWCGANKPDYKVKKNGLIFASLYHSSSPDQSIMHTKALKSYCEMGNYNKADFIKRLCGNVHMPLLVIDHLVHFIDITMKNIAKYHIPITQLNKFCPYREDLVTLKDLLASTTTIKDVRLFICHFFNTVFPLELFGNNRNRRGILKVLLNLIKTCGKADKVCVKGKFRLNEVGFVTKGGTKIPRCERDKMINSLNKLYLYIISITLFPLLKSSFYILSRDGSPVFYRKPVWSKIKQIGLAMNIPYFEEVTERYVNRLIKEGQSLGCYTLRFMPKKGSDLRLISLLNKGVDNNSPSVNAGLYSILPVLQNMCAPCPFVLKGKNDLCKRLSTYKKKLLSSSPSLPELYHVSVDIEKCYDNINIKLLVNTILPKLTMAHYYHVVKYRIDGGRIKSIAFPARVSERPSYTTLAHQIAESKVVKIENVFTLEGLDVRTKLTKFLMNSFIKHEGKFYRRKRGFPQGANVAKVLCDLFFWYVLHDMLPSLCEGFFVSATDDFLLITDKKVVVEYFLANLTGSLAKEFGFTVNATKTQTFDESHLVKFFGININVSLLTVLVD